MFRIEDVVINISEDVVTFLCLDKPFGVHGILAHVVIHKIQILDVRRQSSLCKTP